jgi:hypothetical protein
LPRPHFVSSSHLFFLQKKCAILILLYSIYNDLSNSYNQGRTLFVDVSRSRVWVFTINYRLFTINCIHAIHR